MTILSRSELRCNFYYKICKWGFITFWWNTSLFFPTHLQTRMYVCLSLASLSKANNKIFVTLSTASESTWQEQYRSLAFSLRSTVLCHLFRFAAFYFILTYAFRTFSCRLSAGGFCWDPFLTHCGRVTQICVFTLQLRRTGEEDLLF